MKRNILWASLLISFSLAAYYFNSSAVVSDANVANENSKHNRIPVPTAVHQVMADEADYEAKRDNYFDLIHTGGQDIDWKKIMNDNFEATAAWVRQMKQSKALVQYANAEIAGEWFERGSNDQAGNVGASAFDQLTEDLYAVSDGGIIWKGNINSTSFVSLNDHERFKPEVISTVRLANGNLRILAAKGRILHYSDDQGLTWTASTGYVGPNLGVPIDLYQLTDSDSTILYLYTDVSFTGSATNRLAVSTNHGQSFSVILNMNSNQTDNASIAVPYGDSIAYILDWDDEVYRYENGALIQIATNLNLSGTFSAQLEVTITPTDTILYALMDGDELYKSTDAGFSFNYVADLPTGPWECGFGVSIDNPDLLYYGEVNMYRSTDGGLNWNQAVDWVDYYNNPIIYPHADVMEMATYKKTDGTEFVVTANHGGLYISYDGIATHLNLGQNGLNTGQFYDVATSPINSAFIYGGTQDQGLQRSNQGQLTTVVNFEQIISGDYGAQQFSNYGQSFWTEYPFGQFSYYNNVNSANWSEYWFDIDGDDMPNADWIIPTGAAPNPEDDYILVGGGSAVGGPGSFLIKLENIGSTAIATNFPFDFKANGGRPIGAIETTPLDDQKWYVSCENGNFFHSEDAGLTWTESTSNMGPGSSWIWSSDIYASRITPGLVFLGGTNYVGSNVYMSTDGGDTFVGITNGNGMPSTMVHELCMDASERFLFAATDAGPYIYSMMQDDWFYLGGTDAPIQSYTSCEFVTAENTVRFATYGRGIWDFKIADLVSVSETTLANTGIYPNPSNGLITLQATEYSLVKVVDLQGKVVAETPLLAGSNPLDLRFLKAGVYLIVGTDSHGRLIKERIVIR